MSYFSIALQRAAESGHKSQTDIGNLSGVSRSFISRLMTGDAAELSDKHFTAILRVFASSPRTQAEIIAARCLDILAVARAANTPGAELVEISIKGHAPTAPAESSLPEHVHLSRETEKAFAWLRSQCPVNPDLEKHLVGYARMLGMT